MMSASASGMISAFTRLPRLVFGGHPVGLRCQSIPERFIGLDGPAGVEALKEKLFEFPFRFLETGAAAVSTAATAASRDSSVPGYAPALTSACIRCSCSGRELDGHLVTTPRLFSHYRKWGSLSARSRPFADAPGTNSPPLAPRMATAVEAACFGSRIRQHCGHFGEPFGRYLSRILLVTSETLQLSSSSH
jgi:hypothetical protein